MVFFWNEKYYSEDTIKSYLINDLKYTSNASNEIFDYFISRNIIINSDSYLNKYELWFIKWRENWRWMPAKFHIHTSLIRKFDYSSSKFQEEDNLIMEERVRAGDQPSNYKESNWVIRTIELDNNKCSIDLMDFDSCFNQKDIKDLWNFNLETLWKFLRLCYGETSHKKSKITGTHVAKTVPSWWSRHPTEIYLIWSESSTLWEWIYHYNVKNHSLELLNPGIKISDLLNTAWFSKKQLPFDIEYMIIYTSIPERSMFRYRESRSYRAIHHDVWHILTNTKVIARWFCKQSFDWSNYIDVNQIEKLLKIDWFSEFVIWFNFLW